VSIVSTALVAPIILALLIPLVVMFAAQLFARTLSTFSTHFEIDRRLRKDPRATRRLMLQPWRRESMALQAWQSMPFGREREDFARALRRHDRAMNLQTGLTVVFYVAWIATWRSQGLVWVVGALILALVAQRLRGHRRLAVELGVRRRGSRT
jgi:hypothetical protein